MPEIEPGGGGTKQTKGKEVVQQNPLITIETKPDGTQIITIFSAPRPPGTGQPGDDD